jgi:hypothetical protein
VIIKKFDVATADRIYYEAGELAGRALYETMMAKGANFNEFIKDLQELLARLKIGIFRVEKLDLERMKFTLTLEEDLDCSGLPICNETICAYDEGFFSGLLSQYTGNRFAVKEIDCWCSGARVCRFEAKPELQGE